MSYTIKGLDASHWDGNPEVDIHKAKEWGIQFWFEKATDGLSTDPTFNKRQQRVRDTFSVRGWYHFCHCDNIEADAQGKYFADKIGPLQKHEYAVFDVEQGWGSLTGLKGIEYLLEMIKAFKTQSGAIDDQIIIYGSLGWLRGQFGDALNKLTDFHLWAARYGVKDLGNTLPWSAALIWQSSENATIPGVSSGSGDLDYWLDDHWLI